MVNKNASSFYNTKSEKERQLMQNTIWQFKAIISDAVLRKHCKHLKCGQLLKTKSPAMKVCRRILVTHLQLMKER